MSVLWDDDWKRVSNQWQCFPSPRELPYPQRATFHAKAKVARLGLSQRYIFLCNIFVHDAHLTKNSLCPMLTVGSLEMSKWKLGVALQIKHEKNSRPKKHIFASTLQLGRHYLHFQLFPEKDVWHGAIHIFWFVLGIISSHCSMPILRHFCCFGYVRSIRAP